MNKEISRSVLYHLGEKNPIAKLNQTQITNCSGVNSELFRKETSCQSATDSHFKHIPERLKGLVPQNFRKIHVIQ
jgi:hypothetical protein